MSLIIKPLTVVQSTALAGLARDIPELEHSVGKLEQMAETLAQVDAEEVIENDLADRKALEATVAELKKTVNQLRLAFIKVSNSSAEQALEAILSGYSLLSPKFAYAKAQQAFTLYNLTTYYSDEDRSIMARGVYDYFAKHGFENKLWLDVYTGAYPTPTGTDPAHDAQQSRGTAEEETA